MPKLSIPTAVTADPALIERAKAVGAKLQKVVRVLGGTEVLIWFDDGVYFGVRGDAQKLQSALDQDWDALCRKRPYHWDMYFQRALGLEVKVEVWPRTYTVRGMNSEVGVTMGAHPVSIGEIWGGLRQILGHLMGEEQADLQMLPSEGEPYMGKPTPYYNLRTKKWVVGQAPMSTDPERPGEIDFCALLRPVAPPDLGLPTVMRSGKHSYFVAHCGQFENLRETLASVEQCGGFLFLSLSVGPYPASNFGPVCWVFDPAVVVGSLAPYRQKRRPQVSLYTTDTWTEDWFAFMPGGRARFSAYIELTGGFEPSIYPGENHFYVLGPQYREDKGEMIESVTALGRRLKVVERYFPPGMTAAQFNKAQHQTDANGDMVYPYLEAKCRGSLPWSAVRYCIIPADSDVEGVRALLAQSGFQGRLLTVPHPYPAPGEDDRANVYAYALRAVLDQVE